MPVNEKYKVVFVHIPKNGGTTIEYLLGMHGGIETIGVVPYVNQVKNDFLFGAGAQEFSALEIKREIGSDKFDSFTSFCVIRNPYSRLVSYVAWAKQYRPHVTSAPLSLDEFNTTVKDMYQSYQVDGFENIYLKPQWNYVSDENNNLIVDHVFKFESYEKALAFVSYIINAEINSSEHRMPSNHSNFTDYLTPLTIKLINEMYSIDFDMFEYQKLQ